MLGRSHLAFGVATSVGLVALTGAGERVHYERFTYVLDGRTHALTISHLDPLIWVLVGLSAGLGSVLPDIDQPGSLITQIPAHQTTALRRVGTSLGKWPGSGATRFTLSVANVCGKLLTTMLGGYATRTDAFYALLLFTVAALAGALAIVFRWLPPVQILSLAVQVRHAAALGLATIASVAGLVAAGGVAGLVHRLPGHHRGWTHAPPVAAALVITLLLLGPAVFPALPCVGAAFGFGYASHLIADALTISGIPRFLPGEQRPSLHLLPSHLRVRTGSISETLFNLCWPVILVATIVISGT
jgi:membrane-bound metal-dependent hydrolase YbcI (DUF457 family)